MYLRLQKYDVKITYRKGSQLVIADTLSRAYLTKDTGKQDNGDETETCAKLEEINLVADLPISDDRLKELRDATADDPVLQQVREYVEKGWPTSKQYILPDVVLYYSFQSEISYQNGLIFKSERIGVPHALRDDMKKRLHSSHLGVEGYLKRAREILYWPKMSSQVKESVSK